MIYNWRQFFKIFGKRVVATEDCEACGFEVRYRFVHVTPFGEYCRSIAFRDVQLNLDGTTSGCIYVRKWKEI